MTKRGIFKMQLSTIKDQFKDVKSDIWGTVIIIVYKFTDN